MPERTPGKSSGIRLTGGGGIFDGIGDIGQMVAETFKVGDKVDEDTAAFGLAFTVIQPSDMAVNEIFPESVNIVFGTVNDRHERQVMGLQQLNRVGIEVFDAVDHRVDLGFDMFGKNQVVVNGTLGIFGEIVCDLGNTHHVSDVAAKV